MTRASRKRKLEPQTKMTQDNNKVYTPGNPYLTRLDPSLKKKEKKGKIKKKVNEI